jgi:EAL domain-containing protein (putative c-di-GMP-specific phosphodiesterase class I)
VVFAEEGESDLDGLLARAGAALHQAKGAGRGGFAFHCESMTRQVQREAELVERLGRAAADGEPILRGQPRVALADWSVDGVELRLHWPQAPDSLADPEALARLAERPAPLLILGRWIPPAAAAQARRWRDLGLPFGRVSLDCPSRPQDCASLAQGLLHAARDQGLEPARLELALREGALLEGGAALGRLLAELDEAGMRLTLRGFGAGVSSLGLLRRLPIRAIRLDPELVRALPGAEAQATVGAALALAQSLGLDTQAAGVEDEAQARLLAGLGCRTAQGPWIAGPLDWAELERRLGAGSTLVPAGDQPRAAPL